MPLSASLIRYIGFASSPLLGTAPAGAVIGPLGSWACPPLQLANLTASACAVLAAPPMYRGLARPAAHAEIALSEALSEAMGASAPASDGAVLSTSASTATSTASTETHGAKSSSVRHHFERMPPPTEVVALLLPTSLCSSEIARSLAAALQEELATEHIPSEKPSEIASSPAVRFVALPHTEGCGLSDERLGAMTLLGHLRSPLVAHALLLEHGCALGTAPEWTLRRSVS